MKTLWTILTLILIYGLFPTKFPDYSNNYEKSNQLLIDRQVCGCPCAEGVIKKGKLAISQKLKDIYPQLNDNQTQITLTNFPPFDNITNERLETFYFANENYFKITGQVIGVDTILCNPEYCELAPKFKVSDWTLIQYYPNYKKLNILMHLAYIGLWIVVFPILTIVTIYRTRK